MADFLVSREYHGNCGQLKYTYITDVLGNIQIINILKKTDMAFNDESLYRGGLQ